MISRMDVTMPLFSATEFMNVSELKFVINMKRTIQDTFHKYIRMTLLHVGSCTYT